MLEREQSQAGAKAEDQPPIRLLCFLPSAPQASPKWVLRRRPRNLVADDELRGRGREREQSQAGAKAEDQITPPPLKEEARGQSPICLLCFLPSAPQGSPKWVLRRRPRKIGGRATS